MTNHLFLFQSYEAIIIKDFIMILVERKPDDNCKTYQQLL